MYGLKKRSKQDENGLIQGAGTGTSDSIKKNVPAGSYIMPADSTQQIGTNNLKNMGSPTPVNLSNGEFQLPPEQVHSVGVQTLDAMKDQTHMSVNQPQLGFKPGQNKPELFFANGGLVPDEEWLRQKPEAKTFANSMSQNTPNAAIAKPSGDSPFSQRGQPYKPPVAQAPVAKPPVAKPPVAQSSLQGFAKNMIAPQHDDGSWNFTGGLVNTATGLGAAALGATGGLVAGVGEVARSAAATLGEANNYDRGNMVGQSFDFAGNGLSQAKLGVRQMFGLTPKDSTSTPTSTNTTPPPATKSAPTAQAAEKAKADTAAQAANNTQQPSDFPTTQQPIGQQQNSDPYAIQQKGNSFSYANPSAAAEARAAGVPELQRTGIQTGRGIRGVNEFMANTRKMGPSEQQIQNAIAQREMNLGMQGYAGIARQPQVPERTPEQEAQLQAEIKRVSAPIAGARGLTASQRNQINDLQQGYSNRANDMYKTDANNFAALQREAMGQAGQNYRTELGEQGANNRFGANLGFEAQKFNATNDLANREFTAEQLDKMPARMKQQTELNLLQQYDAAQTDEERKPILEKLGMLRGQSQQQKDNKLIPFKQHEVVDAKGNVTQQAKDYFLDPETRQTIDPMAQMQQLPPIDQNPTALSIKNDKNLNNDEKVKRLIALGYANA